MTGRTATKPQTLTLSSGQIGLMMPRLPALSEDSPLAGATAAPASGDRDVLMQAGLIDSGGALTGHWQAAFRALAAPRRRIAATIGTTDNLGVLHAFQGTDGPLTGYTPRGGGEHMLAHPLEALDIVALFSSALGLEARTPDPGAGADLTLDAVLALAGLADAVRELEAEALLERTAVSDRGVDLARVLLALREGWLSGDMRWLVPVVRRMIPLEPEIAEGGVRAGLAELARVGWVEGPDDGGRYAFSPVFEPVRRSLCVPVSFGALSIVSGKGPEGVLIHFGAMRTLGALWAFEFAPGTPPLMRVGTTEELPVLLALNNQISQGLEAASGEAPRTAAGDGATRRVCGQCGAPIVEGDRFCTACGGRIDAPAVTPPDDLAAELTALANDVLRVRAVSPGLLSFESNSESQWLLGKVKATFDGVAKIEPAKRRVIWWDRIKKTSAGAGGEDMGVGRETFVLRGIERSGSGAGFVPSGDRYSYDFGAVRELARAAVQRHGWEFKTSLSKPK